MSEILRRVRDFKVALYTLIVMDDAFGLEETKPIQFNVRPTANAKQYAFLTSDKKLEAFSDWLESQLSAKVLGVGRGQTAWTAKYIESAYKRGLVRAYTDVNKAKMSKKVGFYLDSRQAFLKDSFAAPERLSKVRMLATRTFEGMKGFTAAEKSEMNRILADGMVNGRGVKAIARDMRERIDVLTKKRALVIARTEIIHAHAEGQLDAFKEMGVDELGVMAEWSTAGDDHVCPECHDFAANGPYKLDEARGMIPAHPNCRCSWIPFVPVPTKKSKR